MARVLLVTNDFPPDRGGIQTYLDQLASRTSHEVRVLAPANDAAEPDVRIVRHPRWRFMLATPRVRRWITDQAGDFGAQAVVFGAPHPPALLGPSIQRRTGLPYVVICHGAEVLVASWIPGVRTALRRSLRGAAVRLAVSQFTADKVAQLASRPAMRLGVGMDPVVSRDGERTTDVISVSRLVPRKGHHRLIDALARLEGWSGRLWVVGSGRRAKPLARRADRRGVNTVFEHGLSQSELNRRLGDAAVFAMPCRSRWLGREVEGLGIVFLEAAAAGLPVIAGRSGGAPETIIPGRTGYLAESVSEVTEALERLLDDPSAARRMGAAGREFVTAAYSWADVINRFDGALSTAAGDSRS